MILLCYFLLRPVLVAEVSSTGWVYRPVLVSEWSSTGHLSDQYWLLSWPHSSAFCWAISLSYCTS